MVAVNNTSSPPLAELRDEADRLRQVRQQLATRLVDAAEQLESPGFPPAAALIDALIDYRHRMRQLASVLGAEAGVDEVSLSDLERLIAARDFRQLAEAVLEQLTELTHVDIPDFAPLVLCQREASRLCELAAESPDTETNPELDLLTDRRHPLNSLIRLCDEGDQLSDADWTECHDNVAATYGRQLATALTRGRIQRRRDRASVSRAEAQESRETRLQTEPATLFTGPSSPMTQAFQPPVPIAGRHDAASSATPSPDSNGRSTTSTDLPAPSPDSIFETTSATIFDVTPPSLTSATRLRLAAYPLELTEPRPAPSDQAPATARPVAGSVTSAAAADRNATADGRRMVRVPVDQVDQTGLRIDPHGHHGEATPELVIRLMAEGRLPMAMQLTRCLEQRLEQPDAMPPSWLLRALILGRHLSYSKGEIARQLEDELREFRPEVLSEGSDERRLAMSFLLRAAALPAVLLAGSATATGILRSFKIAPGSSQLYNYCSRIALYGDRLAGHLVEMFRPAGTITGASELEELSQSAGEWLEEAAKNAVAYSRTSPLFLHAHWTLTAGTAVRHAEATSVWCKWQETLSMCHQLLKPIFDGAHGERNLVRQEIARLTSQVRVEPLDLSNRAGIQNSAGRGIVLPREEMHGVIMEAVAIANRWLRLCHQTASGGGSPVPLEALELRDEILNRSDGVLGELTQHRHLAESPLVKAAITCCQSAVRQIQALFESRLTLPIVEPDPRHVLNADLLRIPGIELNDEWLPETEPAIVERELVACVEQSELNWRQSYDHHARAGNHEATARLLDLDVWSSPEEQESLGALRQSQIAENRIAVDAELDELAGDIATIADAGTWSESDCATFDKRLERLRHELPRVVNFGLFRRQVRQLQSAILRQRTGTGMPTGLVARLPVPEIADPQRQQLVGTAAPDQSEIPSCDIFSGE